jgi:hypothetical protein
MQSPEQEIIEKFHQLPHDAQIRVRAMLAAEAANPAFDFDAWVRDIETVRAQIRESGGSLVAGEDAIAMLRDIREGDDE